MKRLIAGLLLLASLGTDALAQNSTRWVTRDILWSTTNSSTVNGLTPRDSVFLQKNSAGTFNGTGENASGYADTTQWFSPLSWEPSLDLNAFRSNIASAGGADTTFYLQWVLSQEPGASVTASIDSVALVIQGSYNGSSVTSATSFDLLDASATESVQRTHFSQVNCGNPSAVGPSTMACFPFVRFIFKGDHGGKMRLTARYLTRDQ